MIKKMDITTEIHIEKNGTAALDYIERYKRYTDGLSPDLIIFEYKCSGDLFYLDHMKQCGIRKSSLMIFNLQETGLSNKLEASCFYKNGMLTSADIQSRLQVKVSKVA